MNAVNTEKSLREEISFLEEENRQLKELLKPPLRTPAEWLLTKVQEKIFLSLLVHPLATREFILSYVYWDREDPGQKALDVYMYHIRTKTLRNGVQIDTIRDRGFSLRDREKWKKLLENNRLKNEVQS